MALLPEYNTPAFVQDFPNNPALQKLLGALWSANVNRWVNAALIGDIWDRDNYGPRPAFYNPLQTDTPSGALVFPITWNAFPARLSALFPSDSASWNEWADLGNMPPMSFDICRNAPIPQTPYTPTGPRGWQDEYCEWSVTRDADGKILSVMFTCENPEYWLTLWRVDPNAVLENYRNLVSPGVQLYELYLIDSNGHPVVDPATGLPAYNPLNAWNNGTQSTSEYGGAMHLTSSPNTLGAEFDLAAAATIPRVDAQGNPIISALDLVCCAKYGRAGRHSDPTIGQNVNSVVNSSGLQGVYATLTDPPGLYMQTPDFSGYVTPDGTDASHFWTVNRGQLKDPSNPNDIDRILHATFAVPPSYGYTVSDIQIGGANQQIKYGSQIAATITMALSATGFASGGANQQGLNCTIDSASPIPYVQVIQDAALFAAYRAVEANANEIPLSVPILSYPVTAGTTATNVAVLLNTNQAPLNGEITADGGGVTFTITGTIQVGDLTGLLVEIAVDPAVAPGDRGVYVNLPGQPTSPTPSLGLLNVVPAASLGAADATAAKKATEERVAKSSGVKASVIKGRS